MNNTNPFLNPATLAEQKNRKRARVKVAVYSIFGFNIVLMCFMLIQGCKKEQPDNGGLTSLTPTNTDNSSNVVDTNLSNSIPNTNVVSGGTNVTTPIVPPQAPPPPPEPPAAPVGQEYVVVKGDSFYTIAKHFGVKVKDIENANPNVNPTRLKIGQKLQIPAASGTSNPTLGNATPDSGEETYTVKSGDSLTKIAHEHGITVKALRAANALTDDKIKVGQKLKIPAKPAPLDNTPAPTPVPAPAPAPVVPAPSAPAGGAPR
jgi:LysM repeat protein